LVLSGALGYFLTDPIEIRGAAIGIWGGEVSDASILNPPDWDNGHLVTLGLIYQ
jgi:hypothetical protein